MAGKRRPLGRITLAWLCAGLLGQAQAASLADWEGCSSIAADADRLACYDRVSGRSQPEAAPAQQPAPVEAPPTFAEAQAEPAEQQLLSTLSRHWELDDEAKQGAFLFRAHRPNYLLPLKYSTSPNSTPFQESFTEAQDLGLDRVEAELQLSFKIKGMEGVFGYDDVDLWFGYTVTSFWQAYNSSVSSPFRETNYEPEAMLVYRTNYEFLGFRGRFLNLGVSHQSNGRGEDLSRSWNRVYAQLGIERGNLALMIRPWYRLPEDAEDDDNPDIDDYLGRGDLQAVYHKGRNTYSLLLRNNFKSKENHGAVKLNWSFPLHGRLKGYVQYFDGYGESLIDYNHSQQSLGVGLSLTEGM
jgi:phospholipase A1